MNKDDEEYFARGTKENTKFLSRYGNNPIIFENAKILDVGCGHGSLCIDMAIKGAKKVIGVDINPKLIKFAKLNLKKNYPQLTNKVRFYCMNLSLLREYNFDYIISKDSFEHIINLDNMIHMMKLRLNKNGKIYAGFGPLYYSFFGDHRRTNAIIPWGHIIIPEDILIDRINKKHKLKIKSIYDLGLNKLKLSEYKKIIRNNRLKIVYECANASNNIIMKLFSVLSRIPIFKDYFIYNAYLILKK